VIGLFGVAPLDVREGSFGQLGFKIQMVFASAAAFERRPQPALAILAM